MNLKETRLEWGREMPLETQQVPVFFSWGVGRPVVLPHVDCDTLGDPGRARIPILIIQKIFLKHLLCGQV